MDVLDDFPLQPRGRRALGLNGRWDVVFDEPRSQLQQVTVTLPKIVVKVNAVQGFGQHHLVRYGLQLVGIQLEPLQLVETLKGSGLQRLYRARRHFQSTEILQALE